MYHPPSIRPFIRKRFSRYRISSETTGRICLRCSPRSLVVSARKCSGPSINVAAAAIFDFHLYRISSETAGEILSRPCIWIRTTQYDPSSFLWMFSLLLKELIFYFYLPSLQLVLCSVSAVKRLPVHQPQCSLYFTFWPLEISVNILRNQKKIIGLDSYSRQVFNYLDPMLIYISLESTAYLKFAKLQYVSSGFRCRVITGSLMRLY